MDDVGRVGRVDRENELKNEHKTDSIVVASIAVSKSEGIDIEVEETFLLRRKANEAVN